MSTAESQISFHRLPAFVRREADNANLPINYEAAKKAQAQMHAERVATIADDVEQGKLDPASARVASENRKWVAGKLDSAYSDRAALDIQVTNVADMHLLALRERMRLEAKTVEDTRLLVATEQ